MKTHTHTHTPGNWFADICKNNSSLSSVHSFGEIPELMRPWNVAICTGPQAHANARLIAAAPDLLEALEDAAFLMRMAAKIAGPMQDSFKRSAEDAAKAIAKAEGVK
jgi:hypothetical protein